MRNLIVISVLLASTAVHAESLEERKFWRGQMDYMQKDLDSAGKSCGTKFTFEWVGKPTLRAEAKKHNHSPYGICSSAVSEIESLCRAGKDEQETVKEKIKGFKCGYANPRSIKIKGGTLTYMGNNEQSNFSQWATPVITKQL